MSPVMQTQDKRRSAPENNIYTVLLAIAFLGVLAIAGLVVYMCHTQYGTIFKIAS